jgi:hypothetical protein
MDLITLVVTFERRSESLNDEEVRNLSRCSFITKPCKKRLANQAAGYSRVVGNVNYLGLWSWALGALLTLAVSAIAAKIASAGVLKLAVALRANADHV